ncbi:MarR family transcriptional regulator [Elizabethkingia miricola]|uniref:MarR family winged helix-turn-helix transcriptional regulator n=1 Tax=Elizabethkingia bruuniana TaxID=1756149 RepID=UPI0009999287|nr:MarR family winged helix-turn-helix transcriptional regulator [Elizabethkingia bruuniana]OPC59253.1 MarR family transcriptional regulator [Elizabethkingia bruuniana]OPC64692.1 MarR family transcriptional regulator [Elizabethkingia bruuniana]RBI92508.1 MarR family transcriptional regulator [Elizabethkingia miricola]
MNVINEAGILAISTRLHRLSEQLRKDGAMIYQTFGIDFELKWFPVIFTIYKKKVAGVVEIANEIGYTHPSTINLLKELEKKKLIQWEKDKQDERKRLFMLTSEGKELIEKMQPVWELMSKILGDIADNENNLLKAIDEAEEKIANQSFYQRALQLKNSK